ncbi:AAA family ATPase [Prochlorococcus sp. MIT 1307]|uniref:AAA family ATPase n=1 Tax=Prochlorococcus sp. MIT 1307 TaxID=3096219 RepID=UPI002A74C055|nr:AAA family ATPase [Prochlorococcus sp. MIT 1307]
MAKDLFNYQGDQVLQRHAPLAERLRPKSLDEFLGQKAILAEGRLLRRAIAADRVGNLLLHGPPGVGKTTLAKIIAVNTRSHFTILNAVLSGVKELRYEIDAAKQRLERHNLRTILFIDEVHRFNSAQQDALLPWVENGTVTLIGATTENPYFEVNKALVSRSRLFRLQHLETEDLHKLIERALRDRDHGYGDRKVTITDDAASHLVDVANGDARSLLNALELAVESTPKDLKGCIQIDLSIAEESIQERAVLYDKQGDAHFDTISAFIKSLRGSDPDAALFWLARMVEAGENPRFIFRRMLIAAGEDIGLADPQAIVVVEACAAAFERIGLPEGLYPLAEAALYLASTTKSNSVLGFFEAQKTVRAAQRQEVPSHLRDAHRDRDAFGDGFGYRYPHAFAEHWVAQQYLPKELQGEVFWKPSKEGWEGKRREVMMERRAVQLAVALEVDEENSLLVSSGPETPQLERWLKRQLSQEGNRLKQLLDRLWAGVIWQRNDRVLVIARSILWALTPLRAVPEGGVSVLGGAAKDLSRLSAELNLLDPIQRPHLMESNCKSLYKLPSDLHFEWVGGRLHSSDVIEEYFDDFWEAITRKCTHNTGLRLLVSYPMMGPAESLRAVLNISEMTTLEIDLFKKLINLEKGWLTSQQNHSFIFSKLEIMGWTLEREEWEESLKLKLDEVIELRWFSKGSKYRNFLGKEIAENDINLLHEIMKKLKGCEVPQNVIHQRIIGRLCIS